MTATFIQLSLFSNIYFGAALFMDGFSRDPPPVDIGLEYADNFELKGIYLARYFMQDQFLFKEREQKVLNKIEKQIKSIYAKRKDGSDAGLVLDVDTVDYSEIGSIDFLTKYVRTGVPVIIKNFNSEAVKNWSAKYFAEKYPNHKCEVVNTSSVTAQMSTLSEFYSHSMNGEPLYLRSLSDIFDKDPVCVYYLLCSFVFFSF